MSPEKYLDKCRLVILSSLMGDLEAQKQSYSSLLHAPLSNGAEPNFNDWLAYKVEHLAQAMVKARQPLVGAPESPEPAKPDENGPIVVERDDESESTSTVTLEWADIYCEIRAHKNDRSEWCYRLFDGTPITVLLNNYTTCAEARNTACHSIEVELREHLYKGRGIRDKTFVFAVPKKPSVEPAIEEPVVTWLHAPGASIATLSSPDGTLCVRGSVVANKDVSDYTLSWRTIPARNGYATLASANEYLVKNLHVEYKRLRSKS